MDSYIFLFQIALILLSTKLLGLFSRRMKLPQVVGALLAGLILGPGVLNVLQETDFIKQAAELGVIVLMFTAGLETNVGELKRSGKACFLIAICGFLLSIAVGFAVSVLFLGGSTENLLRNIFIGVIIASTSVSIAVETLKEFNKLDTHAGSAILGAALIDDIIGIVSLTIITSFSGEDVSVLFVSLRILLYFVFLAVGGYLIYKLFVALTKRYEHDMRRFVIFSFVLCLGMAYISERFFGIADITGAYFAGLIICNTQKTKYIASRFETLSYMFLSPIFFANIGIEVTLAGMTGKIFLFALTLTVAASLSKLFGCGLGARVSGYSTDEALQIGAGMITRGEVSLIILSKGNALGIVDNTLFTPIIIMVVATAVLSPILLKVTIGLQKDKGKYYDLVESPLVDRYRETEQFDLAQQALLKMHEDYMRGGKQPDAPKASQKSSAQGAVKKPAKSSAEGSAKESAKNPEKDPGKDPAEKPSREKK
jgi:Kef-type K+ transport system membrane component KefB